MGEVTGLPIYSAARCAEVKVSYTLRNLLEAKFAAQNYKGWMEACLEDAAAERLYPQEKGCLLAFTHPQRMMLPEQDIHLEHSRRRPLRLEAPAHPLQADFNDGLLNTGLPEKGLDPGQGRAS